jgi:hypothetical protein
VVGLVGLTFATRIEGDDAVAAAQALKLVLELDCRLRPARHHDERLAAAGLDIRQAHAVRQRYLPGFEG